LELFTSSTTTWTKYNSESLSLYITSSPYYDVKFNIPSTSIDPSDFELIIDGTPVSKSNLSYRRSGTVVYLSSYTPQLTAGTTYTVKVTYTGSAVPSFTREGTVTCQQQ